MKILERDFTGFRGAKFTVLGWASRKAFLRCRCDCGKEFEVSVYPVVAGTRKSCEPACSRRRHGMLNTKEYRAWQGMKARCLSERDASFAHYGARGISVCEQWRNSFENFYSDMGKAPKGYSLERIDVNKGYSPDNCKWATNLDQNRNKQKHALLEVDGVTKAVWEWALDTNQIPSTLYSRIRKGWTGREALWGKLEPRPKKPSAAAARHGAVVLHTLSCGAWMGWMEIVNSCSSDRESVRKALKALRDSGTVEVRQVEICPGLQKTVYKLKEPR